MTNYRTDLACEARRLWTAGRETPGVAHREETLHGLRVQCVEILTPEGAEALGKAPGRYFSLSLPRRFSRGDGDFRRSVLALRELLARSMSGTPESVLVAALGNPDVTPDALGPLAASSILVTRHLKRQSPGDFRGFCSLALCRPGVLGTTGVESAAQIAMLCRQLKPELVVAIDALAGCEPEGLCRTVQISDAGIAPGSGVGNDRQELSRESLGVPLVALGVPTVIDAGIFGGEALGGMFVTPRGIDSLVRDAARTVAYAVNLALHPGVTLEDVDALIG